jgi:hypothetical protein
MTRSRLPGAQIEGVDVSLRIWDDMWHAWPVLGELIPESGMAFEEMKKFMDSIETLSDFDDAWKRLSTMNANYSEDEIAKDIRDARNSSS